MENDKLEGGQACCSTNNCGWSGRSHVMDGGGAIPRPQPLVDPHLSTHRLKPSVSFNMSSGSLLSKGSLS